MFVFHCHRVRWTLGFTLSVVLLLGGAFITRAAGPTEGVFFAEGVRLSAYFDDESVRLVFSDGEEVVLPQAVSASGARYTDGTTLFWNKGDEALLEWNGRTYETRLATADNDGWERARAAGVIFRAVGNEPGWLVEIGSDERVHLLLDYGATVLTTPLSEFRVHYGHRERTFISKPPQSPLHAVVRVQERACYDTMSGEGFTSAVRVELPEAGFVYDGCGRDL